MYFNRSTERRWNNNSGNFDLVLSLSKQAYSAWLPNFNQLPFPMTVTI